MHRVSMGAQALPTTILLAEDDADDVRLISRLLSQHAARSRLQVVNDGEQTIRYLSGEGRYLDRMLYPMPDLVLLDIGLPRIDGLAVLRWIRQHSTLRGLIVVMLTGSESQEHLRVAYELHVNSFLKKTPLLTIPEVSGNVLSYWLNINQPPQSRAD